jgi:hypothetical protein
MDLHFSKDFLFDVLPDPGQKRGSVSFFCGVFVSFFPAEASFPLPARRVLHRLSLELWRQSQKYDGPGENRVSSGSARVAFVPAKIHEKFFGYSGGEKPLPWLFG